MYRTIDCRFWTDDKVRACSKDETLLFLYLITNPHSHYSGIYYLSVITMQHEVRLGRGFEGAWQGLHGKEIVRSNGQFEQVWVRNMFEHQGSGHKLDKGVANHLKGLHRSNLIPQFLVRYPQVAQYCDDTLLIPYPSPSDPVSTSPSPVPVLLVDSPSVSESVPKIKSKPETKDFEQFWALYPRKIGKGAARKAWEKINPVNGLCETICQQVERAMHTEQWTKEAGKFIPNPATWLNQARWEDTYDAATNQSTHHGYDKKDYRANTW